MLNKLKKQLKSFSSPAKAKASAWFFKTGPGQYGEGDVFIGVTVPEIRKTIKVFSTLSLSDTQKLLHSKEHEFRLAALLILVKKFEKGDEKLKKKIYELYLKNVKWINNWDLVDLSAPNIVGEYLTTRSRTILTKLAFSKSLWEKRIAVLATYAFIKRKESKNTFHIAEILMDDPHDLIHKSVGWMLREVGKRCSESEELTFLDKYYSIMPRTMLRYAIERLDKKHQAKYMKKKDVL